MIRRMRKVELGRALGKSDVTFETESMRLFAFGNYWELIQMEKDEGSQVDEIYFF